jgi:TolB-like protein/lipoprotein NlpI
MLFAPGGSEGGDSFLFWADLKRRKVIQVAIAYAIVAWLVIQIVVAVESPLSLPGWTDSLVIVLLAIGFPVALVVSWMFDLTPEGLKRTVDADTASTTAASPTGSRRLEYAILGLIVLAVAWLLYRTELAPEPARVAVITGRSEPAEPSAAREKSVAVLPIESLSPNEDDAYFAAGLHEEIIGQLGKIRTLRVISRTSVMRYENSALSIPEIGRELDVGALVESSVRYAAGRIRVTAQLIDTATDQHLWAEIYERPFEDIFAIQTDIATKIAAALEAELSNEDRASIETPLTDSPEAYAAYLRALATFAATAQTLELSQVYFDQAITLDPEFAEAYARKALYYLLPLGAAIGAMPEDPVVRARFATLGRENVEKALALDPDNGLAYTAFGWAYQYEWKWAEMAAAFERAVALNPNEPATLAPHGMRLALAGPGDRERGLSLIRRAIGLDPNRAVWHAVLGTSLAAVGDMPAAAESFQRALDLNPGFPDALAGLAVISAQTGDLEAARRSAQLLDSQWRVAYQPSLAPFVIRAYRAAAMPDDALRVLHDLEALDEREVVSATTWFLVYHALDDEQKALDWLETAIRTHDTYGRFIPLLETRNDFTAPLWDDPRFQKARRDLGFGEQL